MDRAGGHFDASHGAHHALFVFLVDYTGGLQLGSRQLDNVRL
jgi:hypothetical protein